MANRLFPSYYGTGRAAPRYGARFGPEFSFEYEPARRNFYFAAAEAEQLARERRARLQEQLRRITEDEWMPRRQLEGAQAAAGMASSGQYLSSLADFFKDVARQKADILEAMGTTTAAAIHDILKQRYGLSDQSIRALLNTYGQRVGELYEMFR